MRPNNTPTRKISNIRTVETLVEHLIRVAPTKSGDVFEFIGFITELVILYHYDIDFKYKIQKCPGINCE